MLTIRTITYTTKHGLTPRTSLIVDLDGLTSGPVDAVEAAMIVSAYAQANGLKNHDPLHSWLKPQGENQYWTEVPA